MSQECVSGDDREEAETVVGVAEADAGGGVDADDGVDVEVHGQHAVGAGRGGEGDGGGAIAGGMEGDIIPSEGQFCLADGVVGVGNRIAVDSEYQSYGGVTTEDVRRILSIYVGVIVFLSIQYVWQIVLVNSGVNGGVCSGIDRNVEIHCAVTPEGGGVVQSVRSVYGV